MNRTAIDVEVSPRNHEDRCNVLAITATARKRPSPTPYINHVESNDMEAAKAVWNWLYQHAPGSLYVTMLDVMLEKSKKP